MESNSTPQLDRIEQAISTLAEKTSGLETAVNSLTDKTTGLEVALGALIEKTTSLEVGLNLLTEKTTSLEVGLNLLTEKTTGLEVTLNELTAAVANGFAGMEERMATKEELTGAEKRLETRMDAGFEQVAGKIDGLNRRLDNETEERAKLGVEISKVAAEVFP